MIQVRKNIYNEYFVGTVVNGDNVYFSKKYKTKTGATRRYNQMNKMIPPEFRETAKAIGVPPVDFFAWCQHRAGWNHEFAWDIDTDEHDNAINAIVHDFPVLKSFGYCRSHQASGVVEFIRKRMEETRRNRQAFFGSRA